MKSFIALIAVGLDAARIAFSKSKIKETAAAVVVGVGLLVGSTGDVHGQGGVECDPPIYDVCFHKSNWTSAGYATMYVKFDPHPPPAESGQLYEIVWRGLKKIRNAAGDFVETYENKSIRGQSDVYNLSYEDFWWPSGLTEDSYESYGVEIYEGYWDFENEVDGRPTWVRDTWVGSESLYNHQEAAEIRVHALLFPDFDYWTYYCEVDWDVPITPLKYGYILGCWVYDNSLQEYVYQGVHGSPRFDYGDDCSYEFSPRKYVGGFCSYSINPYGPPRSLD